MRNKTRFIAVALTPLVVFFSGKAQAMPIPSESLAYAYQAMADLDGVTNGWNASETYHGYTNADLALSGASYVASTGSQWANLGSAFRFSTAGNATQTGSALGSYGSALMTRTGSTDRESLSYEMWIRPEAGSTNTSLNGQYLFGTQSGNLGRGAYLKFNTTATTVSIEFLVRRDRGMATASWTLPSLDANANGLIDILEDDFIQIVAMYDFGDQVRSANNYAYLSVNGETPNTDSNFTEN